MKITSLSVATTAAILFGTASFADTAFTDTDLATDSNEALRETIADDFEVETSTFGNQGRPIGFSGSLSLRGSASNGNTESVDLGIGADLHYFDGNKNGYSLELSYDYSDGDDSDEEQNLFFDAQYTRDLSPALYGYAKLQGSLIESDDEESDYFAGFGLGYRIYDTHQVRWDVQGGPGYRLSTLNPTDVLDDDVEEAAASVSSDFFYRLSETAYFTNNIDITYSESDTAINNDIGVTMSLSDNLALRTSLVTAYHSDPDDDDENTDNTFGVSLVLNY